LINRNIFGWRRRLLCVAIGLLPVVPVLLPARAAEMPVRVFAAASLTNALTDIAAAWARTGHASPVVAFGASSTLAKQIEAGAPADLYASADDNWMDYLQSHDLLQSTTRRELLATTLVLIAPLDSTAQVRMQPGFDISHGFQGRLCTGEPGVVPVGIYAREALQSLGWWTALQNRIVGTEDVRGALAFVERGECGLGIVYRTDALISDKVRVIAEFPSATHAPIRYPVALVKNARPEAAALLGFLSSPAAAQIFQRYGFTLLQP
jgi:molybdate transport system substrate-binding protein